MYTAKMRADIPTEFNPYTQTFGPPITRRNTQTRQPFRATQPKKKSRRRFYGLVIVLTIIGLFMYMRSGTEVEPKTSVLSMTDTNTSSFNIDAEAKDQSSETSANTTLNNAVKKYSSLEDAVTTALFESKGDYAIVIKNLKTGESYTRQPDKQYEPGSLYKLWVMATVFDQVKQGNLEEDEELSRSIAFLNSSFGISPDNAEQTSGTITQTVSQALNQMITISHNYAAMLLTEKIKLSTVKTYLETNGFNNSKVGTKGEEPLTTASDIARFLEKVYKKELVSPEYSDKMVELMKKQEKNNKLPLYLPSGVVMAHKTGELGMVSHDAGIVYTEKGDYIIVAFSETESPKGAEDRIGKVSEAVYQYFMSK
jgi:beta-lactamase class A